MGSGWRILSAVTVVACGLASAGRADTMIPQNTAARYGLTRAWYAQVGSQRATGTVAHLILDSGTLFIQSSRSMITALDAETGRTLWATQVGPEHHLSSEPAANEKYVAVVNGSVLYVLDRATGHLLWQHGLGAAPGAGPGVTSTHAFVPMVNGLIEGYRLDKGAHQQPWFYKSNGRIHVPPMTTERNVCWVTEKGYFYVADGAGEGIRYRLETRAPIKSRPASWTPELFACSTDGYVYAVNEATGKKDWKFPIGDAIYASPVAIAGKLFVISELSGLYCLDAHDGRLLWHTPKIEQFVSLSPTRVYAGESGGRLAILDAETGSRLADIPLAGISSKLINRQSDRVYLVGDNCVVQCLREIDLKSPVVYTPPPAEELQPKVPAKKPASKPKNAEAETDEAFDEPAMEDADAK